MNPYQPPAQHSTVRKRVPHGLMAGVLLALGVLLRGGPSLIVALSDPSQEIRAILLVIGMTGLACWMWGSFHLALHFGLSATWGLCGLLFIIGLFIIFWAAKQKPRWDYEKARARAMMRARAKDHPADSDSLY